MNFGRDSRSFAVSLLVVLACAVFLASCGSAEEPFTGMTEEPSVRAARLCGLERDSIGDEVRAVADPGPVMVGFNLFIEDPDQGFKFSRDEEYRDLVDMRADPQLFPEKIVCLIGSPNDETFPCGEYEIGEFDDDGTSQSTGIVVELVMEGLDIAAAVYDLETEELLVTEQLMFLQDECPDSSAFRPDGSGRAALGSDIEGADLDAMISDLLLAANG